MRLSDVIAGYWLDKRLGFSKTTIPGYERTFGRLVVFLGDPEFGAITASDVRRFLVHLAEGFGLSKRSVHDAWIPLSSLWTWAEGELGATHVIRGKVKQPGFTKRTIDALTQEQVLAILAAALHGKSYATPSGQLVSPARPTADRERAIILTLLDSGVRAAELCALTVGDYDAKRGRLHVRHGKGDKARFVTVGARCQKAIWRYMNRDRVGATLKEPLFATRTGAHIDRTALRQTLARIGDRAGVPNVHPHRFRHTYAINFLRNGGNLLTLKELLGHESLTMVQRYARIVEADIDAAQAHSPADNWRL